MKIDDLRKTTIYKQAVESVRKGDDISETLNELLKTNHTKIKVNSGHGEWLVRLSLIIQQAYRDETKIEYRSIDNELE